jgi:hypothetical protein
LLLLFSAATQTDYQDASKDEDLFHEILKGGLAGPCRLGNSA